MHAKLSVGGIALGACKMLCVFAWGGWGLQLRGVACKMLGVFAGGLLSTRGLLHAKHSVRVCTVHLHGVRSVLRMQRAAWVCMAQ